MNILNKNTLELKRQRNKPTPTPAEGVDILYTKDAGLYMEDSHGEERLIGPTPASKEVIAYYRLSEHIYIYPGQSLAVDYNQQVIDTCNSVQTGAGWKFVAPCSGFYSVYANLNASLCNRTSISDPLFEFHLLKNSYIVDTPPVLRPSQDRIFSFCNQIVRLNHSENLQLLCYFGDSEKGFCLLGAQENSVRIIRLPVG
jgi:hypothetical protein